MRVLVCGGRNYDNWQQLCVTLDHFNETYGIDVVIHGAYRGADALAKEWAKSRNVPDKPYPALWNAYGPAAGPIRNRQMLVEGCPDVVIAFPGESGTANMIDQATEANVPVWKAG